MARVRGPKCRLCRREGIKLYLKGVKCFSDKCAVEKRNQIPGMHRAQGKLSEYGIQLREKQRLKRIYGMLEQQFRNFFSRASRKKGVTGETLIQYCERRLDNVALRLHLLSSRNEARQFIRHGSILVNGVKVNIPSYMVKEGDKISVAETERVQKRIRANLEMLQDRPMVEWLAFDSATLTGCVLRLPTKADASLPIEENLIVELYSK